MNEQQPNNDWPVVFGFVAGFAVAVVLFAMGALAAKVQALSIRKTAPATVSVTILID